MPKSPSTSYALAERHEALWLRLTALHKDVAATAARRPSARVSDAVRSVAESLLADAVPFLGRGAPKLPVAAPELAGLCVQLGQALAQLDDYEARHTLWSASKACRAWRVGTGEVPVMRLRPSLPEAQHKDDGRDIAELLGRQFKQRWKGAYEQGFAAGKVARFGPPPVLDESEAELFYPRIDDLD